MQNRAPTNTSAPGCAADIDPASVDDITLALARFAVRTPSEAIPDRAYAAARMALLDALGCALAGSRAPGVAPVIDLAKYWGGREEATLWFHGGAVPAPAAAFANSTQLHALDFDDYHAPSDTHVTAVLVPAVLAAAEAADASGRDALAALVLGIEVVGRLGRACMARRDHAGFLPASVIGGFGSAAAACRLQGCTVEQTVNALGIGYAHASGNRQALFDRTLTKRIQPAIAARAGVFAACLAVRDFTGPHRIIGGQPGSLTRIFGYTGGGKAEPPTVGEVMAPRTAWAVEELEYKRFACCGVSDKPIQAAIALASGHDLDFEQINEVRIFGDCVGSPFGNVVWHDTPTPHVLAQFCVPYATASALRNRRYGPAEIFPERIAADRDVDALARRTRMCPWSDYEGNRRNGSVIVQVVFRDGRVLESETSESPRFRSPDDDVELLDKFRCNLAFSGRRKERESGEFEAAVRKLDTLPRIRDFIENNLAEPGESDPEIKGNQQTFTTARRSNVIP